MKKSQSIMSKYSDKSMKKKTSSAKTSSKVDYDDLPPMANYEQRYKGMSKELTKEQPKQTLDEKIAKREKLKKPVSDEKKIEPKRVSVEINGNLYLLGCTENISESRIRKIAALTNDILNDTKANNPGLTNSKISALALLDACDRILTLKDENSNMRTELMYYQQKVNIEEEKERPEPTPMELLANETED